jgi:hypothetical protein
MRGGFLTMLLLGTSPAPCARVDPPSRIEPDRVASPSTSSRSDAGRPPGPNGVVLGLSWDLSPAEAQKTLEARGVAVRYEETRGYFAAASPGAPVVHTSQPLLLLTFGDSTGMVYFDDRSRMTRIEIRSPKGVVYHVRPMDSGV